MNKISLKSLHPRTFGFFIASLIASLVAHSSAHAEISDDQLNAWIQTHDKAAISYNWDELEFSQKQTVLSKILHEKFPADDTLVKLFVNTADDLASLKLVPRKATVFAFEVLELVRAQKPELVPATTIRAMLVGAKECSPTTRNQWENSRTLPRASGVSPDLTPVHFSDLYPESLDQLSLDAVIRIQEVFAPGAKLSNFNAAALAHYGMTVETLDLLAPRLRGIWLRQALIERSGRGWEFTSVQVDRTQFKIRKVEMKSTALRKVKLDSQEILKVLTKSHAVLSRARVVPPAVETMILDAALADSLQLGEADIASLMPTPEKLNVFFQSPDALIKMKEIFRIMDFETGRDRPISDEIMNALTTHIQFLTPSERWEIIRETILARNISISPAVTKTLFDQAARAEFEKDLKELSQDGKVMHAQTEIEKRQAGLRYFQSTLDPIHFQDLFTLAKDFLKKRQSSRSNLNEILKFEKPTNAFIRFCIRCMEGLREPEVEL